MIEKYIIFTLGWLWIPILYSWYKKETHKQLYNRIMFDGWIMSIVFIIMQDLS